MSKSDNVIMVFTARGPEHIIQEGGTYSWVTDPARAKQCDWVVCAQNRHHPDPEYADGREPHRSAFLIGRIAGVVPSPDRGYSHRWMFRISEYAELCIADAWRGWRNPVHYTDLDELGINVHDLQFQPVPTRREAPTDRVDEPASPPVAHVLAAAKELVATQLRLDPGKVRIVIEA